MAKRSRSTSVKFRKSLAKKFETDDAFDNEETKLGGEDMTASASFVDEKEIVMASGEPTYTEILEDVDNARGNRPHHQTFEQSNEQRN